MLINQPGKEFGESPTPKGEKALKLGGVAAAAATAAPAAVVVVAIVFFAFLCFSLPFRVFLGVFHYTLLDE